MGSMIVSVLKTCHCCHISTISHGAMLPLQVGIHYKCQMWKNICPDLCCSLCFVLRVLRLLGNHVCTRVVAKTWRKLRGPQKHLECCRSGEWFPYSFKGKKAELKLLWVFVSTSRNSAERYEDESWNTILMHIWSHDWQQPNACRHV